MTNEKEKKDIYSNHVFIFPFTIDIIDSFDRRKKSFDERVNINKFDNILDKNIWRKCETISEYYDNEKHTDEENDIMYNNYNYFYENVKYALFNENNHDFNIVKSYLYNKSNGKYIIRKVDNADEDKHKDYELDIVDIKLHIYETGVGLLSFNLENTKYSTYNDILNINDFGRRIYPQFLPLKDVRNAFLPLKVKVSFDDGTVFSENFAQYDNCRKLKLSNIIMKILGEGLFIEHGYNNAEIEHSNTKDKTKLAIKPLIDDRMYTICWYKNNDIIKLCEKDLYCDEWYKYLYLDTDFVSVTDYEMKKKLVDDCTYTRWLNRNNTDEEKAEGTLYGLSRYSFMVVTDEGWYGSNIIKNHCFNQYYSLASLLLLQRASILRFSNEVSELSMLKNDTDLTNKINVLYKHYIKFINQLYFREVTAQEQGIELYRIGLKIMNLENEVKALDEEIQELHQYANFLIGEATNDKLNRLTYVSVGLGVGSLLAGYFGMNIFELDSFNSWADFFTKLNWGISTFICLAILISYLHIKNSKK